MTGAAGRTRAPRYKAFQPCVIEIDGSERRAHVLNISMSGALIHVGSPVPPGTHLTLRCGLLSTAGIVAWEQNLRAGIAFEGAIPDARLQGVLGTPLA